VKNLTIELVLRSALALLALGIVVWLLRSGLPFGAVAVVLTAVWLRREVESGRLRRRLRHA
jgi:hypothetical protein